KKHPLGEKRNHPGSKLRQGFWMVFRFGVNNWGKKILGKDSISVEKEVNLPTIKRIVSSFFNT
ncbi:hypothetical protein RLD55_02410, partial [Streptococcus pneumoniae]|nr:hypothetical protein [Streptococcus pneumoniae]